ISSKFLRNCGPAVQPLLKEANVTCNCVGNQARSAVPIVNGPGQEPLRSYSKLAGVALFSFIFLLLSSQSGFAQRLITDDNPLVLPEVGDYRLRILSSTVLELTLITTKQPDPARVN